ncbi:MAG: RNA-binding transcriptional accessory protein [Defluviitaleaceae bacterium]|nr:RNA-binding transcriptional accessory protein [Defluviitaleaceae bacterium]
MEQNPVITMQPLNITAKLAAELSLADWQVQRTTELIDDGNTVPFIARYRKEVTGSLDDEQLRTLHERLNYLRNLQDKKTQVFNILQEQNNLTTELATALTAAATLTEIEDIYRPFRPKRRTRATIAEEKGLSPLADILFDQNIPNNDNNDETDKTDKTAIETAAQPFVNPDKGVLTCQDALNGASDIIAERISDDTACRKWIRNITWQEGFINSVEIVEKADKSDKSDKTDKSEKSTKSTKSTKSDNKKIGVYEMYADFTEPIRKIVGHRILALNRGEKEKQLKISIEAPTDKILAGLEKRLLKTTANAAKTEQFIKAAIIDSYKRLTAPAVEREIRAALTEQAEEGAIKVFGENLRQLLMQPPIKGRAVLAIDPGFRTGCKWAVVDETGKALETGVVYCTINANTAPSKAELKRQIEKYAVELIAIGNGTASRETEQVVAELIKENSLNVQYIIVNEAGASVYSASKLGAEEFPDFDVAMRSAVSIGRRLQDPLAELVKIDPKSIGVGQYQHDMNQKQLGETLSGVVESCVNRVGVNLNTASPSLLAYVAGITPSVAKQILLYREQHGKFTSRKELLKVNKLGKKAFEQCAGFLRIPESPNPLDNTAVHPESYEIAEKFLSLDKKGENDEFLANIAEQLAVGLPTLQDIIKELAKPGRDPREELPPPLLRSDVLDIKDLQEGMELKGTVRNIVDFGAFVDIGVHHDGLVHISQLNPKGSKRTNRIKHPLEVVSVGDIIDVGVVSVDLKRNRIALRQI